MMNVSASRTDGGATRTGWTSRGMHVAVWIATVVTFAAAVVVGQLRQTESGATIESRILAPPETEAPREIAAAYVEASLGLDDAALAALARVYATANTPEVLDRIGLHLIGDRTNKDAGRAGVFLLEAGADLYRSPSLIQRAGWLFFMGRFVERDFEKATHFLSDPRVRYRAAAQYWLGRVLYDSRNPNRDEAAGLALIRAAADRRNELAVTWLERTGQQAEEANSAE